jgi:hypothetical protein
MAASIALGCGGKALVCGSRPWRGRRQARFVTRLHFCHQQFFSEEGSLFMAADFEARDLLDLGQGRSGFIS